MTLPHWGGSSQRICLEDSPKITVCFPKASPVWTREVIWWSWRWCFPCGTLLDALAFKQTKKNPLTVFCDALKCLLFCDVLRMWNVLASLISLLNSAKPALMRTDKQQGNMFFRIMKPPGPAFTSLVSKRTKTRATSETKFETLRSLYP